MSYKVIPVEKFKKEAKRLIKKYASLKAELYALSENLSNNPTQGTALGNNTFKIRIVIKSKGKGKSGGARVITYFVTQNNEIYLLTIYDKSEVDAVSDKAIEKMIEAMRQNKR